MMYITRDYICVKNQKCFSSKRELVIVLTTAHEQSEKMALLLLKIAGLRESAYNSFHDDVLLLDCTRNFLQRSKAGKVSEDKLKT